MFSEIIFTFSENQTCFSVFCKVLFLRASVKNDFEISLKNIEFVLGNKLNKTIHKNGAPMAERIRACPPFRQFTA